MSLDKREFDIIIWGASGFTGRLVAEYLFQKYNFNLEFSKHHRDIVKKFGRFPHRNEIFGRMSTMEELDYLLSDNAFRG